MVNFIRGDLLCNLTKFGENGFSRVTWFPIIKLPVNFWDVYRRLIIFVKEGEIFKNDRGWNDVIYVLKMVNFIRGDIWFICFSQFYVILQNLGCFGENGFSRVTWFPIIKLPVNFWDVYRRLIIFVKEGEIFKNDRGWNDVIYVLKMVNFIRGDIWFICFLFSNYSFDISYKIWRNGFSRVTWFPIIKCSISWEDITIMFVREGQIFENFVCEEKRVVESP